MTLLHPGNEIFKRIDLFFEGFLILFNLFEPFIHLQKSAGHIFLAAFHYNLRSDLPGLCPLRNDEPAASANSDRLHPFRNFPIKGALRVSANRWDEKYSHKNKY